MGPAPLEDLISAFAKLPGIGRVTAQRQSASRAEAAARRGRGIGQCTSRRERWYPAFRSECFNFTERESDRCAICRDERRDERCICVVEEASDVLVLEANQIHRGVFHVLGGLLSPLEGIAPEDLRIGELVARAQRVQAVPGSYYRA